ncbi:MAG TPA: YkgJ family cysteine cluster protein, partial [Methanocellaceae archaeon]
EAERTAETLHERQVRETAETIMLLERFKPFHPSARDHSGEKVYVVHDSEGSRRVLARADGDFSFL